MGPMGPPGQDGTPGQKWAIVDVQGHHIGLYCAEMPDARFEDIIEAELSSGSEYWEVQIDPIFIETCEVDSIVVTSVLASKPCMLGAFVNNGKVVLTSERKIIDATKVTIRVSGIRKGTKDTRFPEFTKEQMEANNAFWSSSITNER